MKILVTGASGKVGQTFLREFLAAPDFQNATVRALCHNRMLGPQDRLEVVKGSISDRDSVASAMEGVTHVLHLATCKETPEAVMDVAVKGMFWLLEEARESDTFSQFLLVGGDACVGHFFYEYDRPITEELPHKAYPGCYALSKVLEEVMLEQYYHQYDLNGCCLRAPWIMEKDDFRHSLSWGEDVFGGPRWCELVDSELAEKYAAAGTVPVMKDADGNPITRNFVQVDDLVSAILKAIDHPAARQQLFNISMTEPVNYQAVADYLAETRDLDSVGVKTEFFSTWLDNCKARQLLGWRPEYDLARLIDSSFDYQRADDDPRKIWYPG
ncbi:MAG: NAD(P)-dependent oxidoreductase [Verrucomicrobiales bacterium]|nr:NAD(P)-dependent oxidoreductase [Verrucomicrobiales bacterium]